MADLIDRRELGLGFAKPEAFIKPEYAYGWNSAIEAINAAPTVDAVEVVRCKDCRYWKRYGDEDDPAGDCGGIEPACCMNEDDFCSYGEWRNRK